MKFLSTKKQYYDIVTTHYCGDGCCSWTECDVELVLEDEVIDLYFDYCQDRYPDEEYFFKQVQSGDFIPIDDEAVQWVAERQQLSEIVAR